MSSFTVLFRNEFVLVKRKVEMGLQAVHLVYVGSTTLPVTRPDEMSTMLDGERNEKDDLAICSFVKSTWSFNDK